MVNKEILTLILDVPNNKKKLQTVALKGWFHQKIKILPSFTHPLVVSNLYDLLSSVKAKEDSLKNFGNRTIVHSVYMEQSIEVNGYGQLQTFFKKSYDDRILIFR